jgi:hypothetical protein
VADGRKSRPGVTGGSWAVMMGGGGAAASAGGAAGFNWGGAGTSLAVGSTWSCRTPRGSLSWPVVVLTSSGMVTKSIGVAFVREDRRADVRTPPPAGELERRWRLLGRAAGEAEAAAALPTVVPSSSSSSRDRFLSRNREDRREPWLETLPVSSGSMVGGCKWWVAVATDTKTGHNEFGKILVETKKREEKMIRRSESRLFPKENKSRTGPRGVRVELVSREKHRIVWCARQA